MEGKIIWKYDQKFRQWWKGESTPFANDGATISKLTRNVKPYVLVIDRVSVTFEFSKLKNAKKFFELYKNG